MERCNGAALDGRRYLIAGGGLQSALLACSILHHQPAARVRIVERDARLGGNHTWCFHAGDLPAGAEHLQGRFAEYAWPSHEVRFPGRTRRILRPYHALSADRLRAAVTELAESTGRLDIRTGCSVAALDRHGAVLDSGERLEADWVIDARGPRPLDGVRCGYQKFLGLEAELAAPAALDGPVLMDACLDQTDGFRFMYILPFSPTRVLFEDTYFSDDPALDEQGVERGIRRYAEAHGMTIASVVRRESGVLPMPWGGSPPADDGGAIRAGFGGGWFHPATGYSFPATARLAEFIGRGGLESPDRWRAFQAAHVSRYRFACLLNRLLFGSFEPDRRWHVFDRFYRFGEPLIERFYAMTFTPLDRARLLSGRPPRGISWRRTAKEGFPLWT